MMPVSETVSVTQSTAPAGKANAQADAPAWQQALASAQSAPQQSDAANASSTQAAKTKAAAGKQSKQDTGQAAPTALPPTPDDKAAAHAKKPEATQADMPILPVNVKKDDKKEDKQNGAATAMIMPVQTSTDKPVTGTAAKAPTESGQVADQAGAAASSQKPVLPHIDAGAVSPQASTSSNTSSTASSGTADEASTTQAHTPSTPRPAAQTESTAATALQQTASTQTDIPSTANIPTPVNTPPASGPAQSATQRHAAAAPPQAPASPPAIASTAQALTARGAQMPQPSASIASGKDKDSIQPISALGGVTGSPASMPTTGTNTSVTITQTGADNAGTSPAALAATVTALHQSGQAGTVLRLDPPGLGHLSVQVGLGAQGQVNVLFVPSTADAAQAIQASLPGLGGAMAQSGLTLGQAQVGGQFSQQGGQGGQGGYTPPRQGSASPSATETQPTSSGLSAYA